MNKTIETRDSENETTIFICAECLKEPLGWCKAYNVIPASKHICLECWKDIKEKAWMYEELCK